MSRNLRYSGEARTARQKAADVLYHCLFPNRCAACGRVVTCDTLFCRDCEGDLPEVTGLVCKRCFTPKDRCLCDRYPPQYERVCAPFAYDGSVKRALISLKRYKNERLCRMLGEYMAREASYQFGDMEFDCVVPVPMFQKRRRARGYNQSELLAEQVAEALDVRLERGLLTQIKNSAAQHSLGLSQRQKNIEGIYTARRNNYRRILLVDDIITTGFTMSACAAALKSAGAAEVYCVGAAKAVMRSGTAEKERI